MINEEPEKFCDNCKRNIEPRFYDSHRELCVTSLKICEVCDKLIHVDLTKEHAEEYHVSVKCGKCKASVKKWKMPKHLEVCPKRLVACEFCELVFYAKEAGKHIDSCGSRTEVCEFCEKFVMLKDRKKHAQKHMKESENLRHPCMQASETDVLSKHFKDLFTSQDYWDAVLQVEDKEFKVHRAVLSARSSVLSDIFQHDKKRKGKVKIPDCDVDSFKLFLEYLYTGKLEDVPYNSVFELYFISDAYDVQELKTSCIKYLMQNIAVENISKIFMLAVECDEENLFSAGQDFFNKNFNEIIQTKEWDNILEYDSDLASKLLIAKSRAD